MIVPCPAAPPPAPLPSHPQLHMNYAVFNKNPAAGFTWLAGSLDPLCAECPLSSVPAKVKLFLFYFIMLIINFPCACMFFNFFVSLLKL